MHRRWVIYHLFYFLLVHVGSTRLTFLSLIVERFTGRLSNQKRIRMKRIFYNFNIFSIVLLQLFISKIFVQHRVSTACYFIIINYAFWNTLVQFILFYTFSPGWIFSHEKGIPNIHFTFVYSPILPLRHFFDSIILDISLEDDDDRGSVRPPNDSVEGSLCNVSRRNESFRLSLSMIR